MSMSGAVIAALAVAGVVLAVVLAPTVLAWRRMRRPQGYLGFAVDDLHEMAVRMLAVEREFRSARIGEITEAIEMAQPLLVGIRPVPDGPRTGRLSLELVKVELLFAAGPRLRGVVDVRELAVFLPSIRSEAPPRLVAARASGGGTELVFEVLRAGGDGVDDRVLHLGELTVA